MFSLSDFKLCGTYLCLEETKRQRGSVCGSLCGSLQLKNLSPLLPVLERQQSDEHIVDAQKTCAAAVQLILSLKSSSETAKIRATLAVQCPPMDPQSTSPTLHQGPTLWPENQTVVLVAHSHTLPVVLPRTTFMLKWWHWETETIGPLKTKNEILWPLKESLFTHVLHKKGLEMVQTTAPFFKTHHPLVHNGSGRTALKFLGKSSQRSNQLSYPSRTRYPLFILFKPALQYIPRN